jgi:hypothetical protein
MRCGEKEYAQQSARTPLLLVKSSLTRPYARKRHWPTRPFTPTRRCCPFIRPEPAVCPLRWTLSIPFPDVQQALPILPWSDFPQITACLLWARFQRIMVFVSGRSVQLKRGRAAQQQSRSNNLGCHSLSMLAGVPTEQCPPVLAIKVSRSEAVAGLCSSLRPYLAVRRGTASHHSKSAENRP